MAASSSQAERILDAALEQAENSSWEEVHLYQVASSMGTSLDEIRSFYRPSATRTAPSSHHAVVLVVESSS